MLCLTSSFSPNGTERRLAHLTFYPTDANHGTHVLDPGPSTTREWLGQFHGVHDARYFFSSPLTVKLTLTPLADSRSRSLLPRLQNRLQGHRERHEHVANRDQPRLQRPESRLSRRPVRKIPRSRDPQGPHRRLSRTVRSVGRARVGRPRRRRVPSTESQAID